jgi:hypothetical protein
MIAKCPENCSLLRFQRLFSGIFQRFNRQLRWNIMGLLKRNMTGNKTINNNAEIAVYNANNYCAIKPEICSP